MLRYLFYIFLAYMLYQLVFKFIIPLYRTTRQVKKGFREMQERMNQQAGPNFQSTQSQPADKKGVGGDYIDFEEVKDWPNSLFLPTQFTDP